jgi:hypothetical protein
VEHFRNTLLPQASDIIGLKRTDHDLIFRHLGTVTIGVFMNEYAERHIKSAAAREQLAFVTKFVDRCRINRNAIVHGWVLEYGDLSAIRITSKADQRRRKETEFSISIEDVKQVCDDIEMAGQLTVAVSFLLHRTGSRRRKSSSARTGGQGCTQNLLYQNSWRRVPKNIKSEESCLDHLRSNSGRASPFRAGSRTSICGCFVMVIMCNKMHLSAF